MWRQLLECPISPDGLFGPRLSSMVDEMQAVSEEAEKFRRHVSRYPPPPRQQRSAPCSRRRQRPPTATVTAPPSTPPPGPPAYQPRTAYQPRPPPSQDVARPPGQTYTSAIHQCSEAKPVNARPGPAITVSHASPATYRQAFNKPCIIDQASPKLLSPHHIIPGMTCGETAAKASSLSMNDTQLVQCQHSVIPPRVPTLRREEATLLSQAEQAGHASANDTHTQPFRAELLMGCEEDSPLDSAVMRARLSQQKMETLWSLLRRCYPGNVVTALPVMRLLGMMSAAHTVVPPGLLHMRRLQRWFSRLRIDLVRQWRRKTLMERGLAFSTVKLITPRRLRG
ncbi:unnamed protein product [Boreogadus saida]